MYLSYFIFFLEQFVRNQVQNKPYSRKTIEINWKFLLILLTF